MTIKFDPNDFDDQRERRTANRVWWLIFAFCLCCAVLAISSCGTQRSACGITEADADSLAVYVEQTISTQQHDTDIQHSSSVAVSGATSLSTDSTNEQEVINENIQETISPDGTTTRNTQRTTTRNNTHTSKDVQEQWQRQQEESLALHLSYLDSLYNSKFDSVHNQQNIFQYENKEVQTKDILADVNIFLGILAFWVCLIIAGGLSYYFTKHHGKEKE